MLALTAPFLLSGCELIDKLMGRKAEDASSQASIPEADIRRQTPKGPRQLLQAYEQSSGGASAYADTDPGRVTFDGVNAGLGDFLRDGPGGVPAAAPRYARRPPIQYSDPQARGRVVGEVPAPTLSLPGDLSALGATARGAGPTAAHFDAFQRTPGLFSRVFDVVSRLGWGAQAPRHGGQTQHPNRVAVHHTDGPQTMTLPESLAAVRNIQHYHRNVADGRKPVWDDIGYHFLIDGAGRVFEGRHAEIMGAHAGPAGNSDSVAISMMGNFNKQKLTGEQRDSLVRLVSFLSIKYRRDPSAAGFIEPHLHFMGTDCPGADVMAFLRGGSLVRESQEMIARLSGDSRFRPAAVSHVSG